MPKELNLVPNERLDLEDIDYGLRAFPVDTHKAHVQRLISGDYSGGFILEGFRVEVNTVNNTLREIIVHNGIALDREGRLITFEEGSQYSNNADLRKSIKLSSVVQDNYIMIEFALADSDKDSRTVWDPTHQNIQITDSAGATHPVPRGKEFPINIPTRQAQSWKIISTTGSFDDVTDAGTRNRTLRIPVAIVPVQAFPNIINVSGLEGPIATIIRQPEAGATVIQCDDTRHFDSLAKMNIVDFDDITNFRVIAKDYTVNDRNNNSIAGFTNSPPTELEDVRVGDRVVVTNSSFSFVPAGSQYDCRPLLFSFNDVESASLEFGSLPSYNDSLNFRNMKYYIGRALLNSYAPVSADFATTSYPDTTGVWDRTVKWPTGGKRSEYKLKTIEDTLTALTTVVREMKYGEQTDRLVDGSLTSLATGGGATRLYDTTQYFDPTYIGATVEIITGPAAGTWTVTGVTGLHILQFAALPASPIAGNEYMVQVRNVTSDTSWVDVKNHGNLNEVYRARIDRVANTWTNDLQERLQANKIPVVTVGDGVYTFGDYTGNLGLKQALIDVYNAALGGIIYVKRGFYTLDAAVNIGTNTVLMGDGRTKTAITFDAQYASFWLNSPGDTVRNVEFRDLTIQGFAAGTAPDTAGYESCVYTVAGKRAHDLSFINCGFIGGSAYTAGANEDKVYNYALNLGTDETDSTAASKNLLIDNCYFRFAGGGIFLQRWMGVTIANSHFETETDIISFTQNVEGIVFAGAQIASLDYGTGGDSTIYGEVNITNCKFLGEQTSDANLPYRGWVFIAPNYNGQGFVVSNCIFIGDRFGDNALAFTGGGYVNALTKYGAGIVKASSGTDVVVSGCQFHSYWHGIVHSVGALSVADCQFLKCYQAVEYGDIDFTPVDAVYTGPPIFQSLGLEIVGCKFAGADQPSSIGILINPPASDLHGNNHITVLDCQFLEFSYAIWSAGDFISSAFVSNIMNRVVVKGCEFHSLTQSAWVINNNDGHSNGISFTAAQRQWRIRTIEYSNNTHTSTGAVLTSTAVNYLDLSAQDVFVKNNSFSRLRTDRDMSYLAIPGGAENLVIDGNDFIQCLGQGTTVTTNLMKIWVSNTSPTFKINNNSSTAEYTSPTGINNGIEFTYLNYENTAGGADKHPQLIFNNNNLTLLNAQFIFLARQDRDAGYTHIWDWWAVEAVGNVLSRKDNSSYTIPFLSYGNDANYSGVNFLGRSDSFDPGNDYISVLDLRAFQPNSTAFPGNTAQCALIKDNVITIHEGEAGIASDHRLANINIGIRISKWPGTIDISGNKLYRCQLVVKWTFDTPRTVGGLQKGCRIKITNNDIYAENEGALINITPATGFTAAGDDPDDISNYLMLTLSNNMCTSISDAQAGVYADLYGVVLLWTLNDDTTGNGETDRLDTIHLMYQWNIHGNTLANSVFIVEETSNCARIKFVDNDQFGHVANIFACVQVFGNTKLCPSTSTNPRSLFGGDTAASAGVYSPGLGYRGTGGVGLDATVDNQFVCSQNMVLAGSSQSFSLLAGSGPK